MNTLLMIHQHRAHILDLVSPDPARVLFGPVVTVAFLPYRDDLPEAGVGFHRRDIAKRPTRPCWPRQRSRR